MPAKGQRTRARIVDHVLPLLNTQGYAGMSMDDIMQATGLKKGGLYNHYPSKEALALAAFDAYVERFRQRYADAAANAPSTVDRLRAIAAEMLRIFDDPVAPGGCLVFNTALEADDAQPELAARARAALHDLLRLVGHHIKRGIRAGELRADVEPRQAATVLVSLCEGAIGLGRLFDDPDHVRRASTFIDAYLDSLRRPKEAHDHTP
jgi:AcrR family transcriptional regulator